MYYYHTHVHNIIDIGTNNQSENPQSCEIARLSVILIDCIQTLFNMINNNLQTKRYKLSPLKKSWPRACIT